MKIIFIITDFGSFNNFLSELSVQLSKNKNVKLFVICNLDKVILLKDKYNYEDLNIKFHFVNIPRKVNLFSILSSARQINLIINSIKPDIIHAHFTTGIFPSVLLKKRKFKYWGTFHGLGMNSSKGLKKIIFTLVETFCFFRLDKIFVTNEIDFKYVINLGFAQKTLKYKCFGFGCDLLDFNKDRFSIDIINETKKELNIIGEKVIVYTGRFVEFKGFDLVIKAFLRLIKIEPNGYKLLIIGGYDIIHSTGLSENEEIELKNNLDIINIGFTNNVAKFLAIADFFLFPSKKEGLPTCVMESLAMGIPTIVSNSRGSMDLIENRINGILIDEQQDTENEINCIIQTIFEINSKPQFANDLRNNSLKRRHQYSRNLFIDEHVNYYLNN
ncbi:glycosyltransferase [Lacihabitans sp. LS3-19]|uniref:glycosyltransferase n=1 Tax=Lacihabitans sp. LS3-19 TaxID=2487335 RepID=UPI0020CF2822|nr:glycosyltransferase [Lacihabitans sp. LS3-19]MCP9769394.1 glycosyltransferase [Lacihabitans sp. LS3-19]